MPLFAQFMTQALALVRLEASLGRGRDRRHDQRDQREQSECDTGSRRVAREAV